MRPFLAALGLVLSLVPVSALAEDGNQAAIDAAKAEKVWLQTMPRFDKGVVLGQREIANAKAIATLLSYDTNAQKQIPNSMAQYDLFCANAVSLMQAKLANATAMVAAKPWDMHAQAELANANAINRRLWGMIGETYPGNPYYQETQVRPSGSPNLSDEELLLAGDEEFMAFDGEMVLADVEITVAEDVIDSEVAVAETAG
jgi:hypothetical protein